MVHASPTRDIDPRTLYAILRLRSEIFVVEQKCAYLDADGRDLDPDCVQLWVADSEAPDSVLATARILVDPDGGHRIGRVCTARTARGQGLASEIVRAALGRCGGGRVTIDAQSRLVEWYATFGFVPTGHEFVEDGIHHTEMVRE